MIHINVHPSGLTSNTWWCCFFWIHFLVIFKVMLNETLKDVVSKKKWLRFNDCQPNEMKWILNRDLLVTQEGIASVCQHLNGKSEVRILIQLFVYRSNLDIPQLSRDVAWLNRVDTTREDVLYQARQIALNERNSHFPSVRKLSGRHCVRLVHQTKERRRQQKISILSDACQ